MVYGEADGMLSNETNGEHQPSGWKGPDGRLWYPTQKGLTVVDPRDFREKERPVPVVIERVLAKGETIFDVLPAKPRSIQGRGARSVAGAVSDTGRLPAGAGETLEFHFAANTFVAPEKTRYRYMLENYDKGWRDAGPQRLAVYTNLRPGDYRFKVIACNHHGVWNERPALFAFAIAPHFHETPWFYALCSAGLLMVALGIHHYRVRVVRRLQELQAQAALSDQRERIARDMHDDLGANLSRIALINEVVRRDGHDQSLLQRETAKIATIAGQTVDSLSELVWAANPKYDTLENLISYLREYIAQFFDQTTFQCQLTVPETIPPAQVDFKLRRHLFLVVKEALHNILKHSRAERAEVTIGLSDDSIHITISDNGMGMEISGSPSGNGLLNMRQRVAELKGAFKIQSSPAQGTILRIVVPLAR
jgi:signal transduction histidine kinase